MKKYILFKYLITLYLNWTYKLKWRFFIKYIYNCSEKKSSFICKFFELNAHIQIYFSSYICNFFCWWDMRPVRFTEYIKISHKILSVFLILKVISNIIIFKCGIDKLKKLKRLGIKTSISKVRNLYILERLEFWSSNFFDEVVIAVLSNLNLKKKKCNILRVCLVAMRIG